MSFVDPRQVAVLAVLEQSGQFDTPLQLQPINGGEVNQSFKLISGNQAYFLKLFAQDELLPTDRQQAYEVQCQAAEFDLALMPVYFNANLGFQVEPWFEWMHEKQVAEGMDIELLASSLAHIHQLPISTPLLNLPEVWHRYVLTARLTGNKQVAKRLSQAVKLWQGAFQESTVLCHNDLALAHISSRSKLTVFDWEYSASGNRFYDLMSCAEVNQLTSTETDQLTQLYCEKASLDVEQVRQNCEIQASLVRLTSELWYAAVGESKKNCQ